MVRPEHCCARSRVGEARHSLARPGADDQLPRRGYVCRSGLRQRSYTPGPDARVPCRREIGSSWGSRKRTCGRFPKLLTCRPVFQTGLFVRAGLKNRPTQPHGQPHPDRRDEHRQARCGREDGRVLVACLRPESGRQCAEARTAQKERQRELVDRQDERHHRAGQYRWKDQRERHAPKRVPRPRAESAGRTFEFDIRFEKCRSKHQIDHG